MNRLGQTGGSGVIFGDLAVTGVVEGLRTL
jgi:hypothetical protein